MAQWHKLPWDEKKIPPIGEEIVLRPHTDKHGKKTVKTSHDHYAFHELDWSEEAATHPETGEKMHHLHNGEVDHIRIHQEVRDRPGSHRGTSIHALWHDKDGKVVRRDALFIAREPIKL